MKNIMRSIFLMEQEKLVLLSEEVKFLYDICRFHAQKPGGEESPNVKKDLESNFLSLEKVLKEVSKDIYKKFKKIKTIIGSEIDDREALYLIDYNKRNTNKIIKKLKLINQKTSQMFRDGYNQYIPKPTSGRMFSNINLTSQVEQNLEDRLKAFKDGGKENNDLVAQVIWDYTNSYKITTNDKDETNIAFFRMSYWYFDLPVLIPALTHELGHISKHFQEIKDGLISYLNDQSKKSNIVKDFLLNHDEFIKQLSEEIFADSLSLLYHGDAFLLTHIHSFLGYYLANTFRYEEKEIKIGFWQFNYHRDSTFIRLISLIKLRNLLKTKDDNRELFKTFFDDYIEESEEILNIVYPISVETSSTIKTFRDIYEDWHNFKAGYQNTEEIIAFFVENTEFFMKENKNLLLSKLSEMKEESNIKDNKQLTEYDIKIKNIRKSSFKVTIQNIDSSKKSNTYDTTIENRNIPKYFNDLWELRLSDNLEKSKVPHKFELRKKIHHDTICRLINENKLSEKNIFYSELIFYKYKINDLDDIDRKALENKIKGTELNDDKEPKKESVLGIYDQLILKHTEDRFNAPEVKNITSNEEKRYISKISMMKIFNDIEGFLQDEYAGVNLTIQIEVEKNLKKVDIYDRLYNDLNTIHSHLHDNRGSFSNAEIYKSLGPKDIVVRINNISIESIYKIKKYFSEIFERTFSTISYTNQQAENGKSLPGKYKLFTELRLHGTNSITDLFADFKNIDEVYMLTGVMDYRVIWSQEATLNDIDQFYLNFINSDKIADMQTRIANSVYSFKG